ncbi:hypothetical protein OAG51_01485 [Pirellulaceae bacterium]|nr:hypothetical protein [Pirellulaceae bacterium]
MHTRLLRSLSLAVLIVFASVIVGCGDASVDVKETVSSSALADTEKEGCCGGCCEEGGATVETSVIVEQECCGKCANDEKVATKECCGKCKENSTEIQLVTTEAEACEYCKEGKACEECKKQKAEPVSTKTIK